MASWRSDDRFSYNNHGTRESTPRRINWVQGTILNYTSGFTEGTVGFSTQVAARYSQATATTL